MPAKRLGQLALAQIVQHPGHAKVHDLTCMRRREPAALSDEIAVELQPQQQRQVRHGRRVADSIGAQARHLVDEHRVLPLAEQRRNQLARASVIVGVRHLRARLPLDRGNRLLDLRVHDLPRGAQVNGEVPVEIVQPRVLHVQHVDSELRQAAQHTGLQHVPPAEQLLVGRLRVQNRGGQRHAGLCVVDWKDQHKLTAGHIRFARGACKEFL
jgi:hypothetical protein